MYIDRVLDQHGSLASCVRADILFWYVQGLAVRLALQRANFTIERLAFNEWREQVQAFSAAAILGGARRASVFGW